MSDLKTAEPPNPPLAGRPEAREHPVDFNHYFRRCLFIFIVILCAIGLMVWISYLPSHFTWAAKAAMILTVATCNAFVVAGFLMHLISEKKMIYAVLAFTVFFAAALMWLSVYAMQDFPTGTTSH
jgi:K+-sensing histidine kinase KdpD